MATNDYSDIYNTYASQRFNRIERRTLDRGLRRYKRQGITFAGAQGKSDARLRQMAVRAVLTKYRSAKRRKK